MGGRWRRRRRGDHDNNNSSSSSNGGRGGAMDLVMIFWHNPLLILAVILLFTPPLYPLLVYFSPLLMSTALCVAALLSIKGYSSEVGDPTVVVVAAAAAAASSSSSSGPPHPLHHHHRRHDDSSDATAAAAAAGAGTWIRVSDVVLADSVSSVAASSGSSFAAHRYEHLVDWSGESQVQRVWSWSTDRAVDSAIQQQSRALRSSNKSSEEEQQQEKDRWTTWVKEYEARPEWNEATAPPSQDGGFAAAVKREQEMRLEKEALKLETEKFRERLKIAAIKANLHRRQKTSAAQDEEEATAVLRQTKPDALAKRHFFDAQTLLSIERFLFTETDAGADPSLPTKTEVPAAQGFHQPKTAPGACVRRERDGSNVEDEEEVKTSGEQKQQQQQQLRLRIAGYLSSESLSSSSTASRGKQVSPRLLHIPLKASSDNGVVGKQSSAADKHHAESTSEEDESSDDQESDADDDDYDDDDDDDSSDHSEIRNLHGMENRSSQQSSEPNPSVVQDLMMPSSTSCSYKASSNSTIGFNVQRVDQHSGTQVDNTPDTLGDSDSDSDFSSSSSSQAFHHYTLKTDCHPLESADCESQEKDKGSVSLERIKITQKTDCHVLENVDCGSQEKDKGSISLERIEITQKTDCHALENADCGSQEKDKGSISLERIEITQKTDCRALENTDCGSQEKDKGNIALERIEITQKTDCHALENTDCGSQEKDKGNIALEKIEITRMQSRRQLKSGRSFVSSLEESCNSQQRSSSLQIASISSLDHRRRSTTTSTLKPLVWRSRSSDSPEMED